MQRLIRIESLITSLTLAAALCALATGVARPLGVAIGGAAALLDFAMLRRLGAAALARRARIPHLAAMASLKSLVLLGVPALALLLPSSLIDGISFAVGVTTLPTAIVLDACLPAGAGI